MYVKGYLQDDNIDRIPLSTDFDRDSHAFTEMVNEYIKDNVGLFSTPSADGNSNLLQRLFPDMKLDPEGKYFKLSNKTLHVFNTITVTT